MLLFVATLLVQARLSNNVERLTITVRVLQLTLQEHGTMSESDDYPEPGYLYTSWYSAGEPPVKRFCKTGQNPNENRADWTARHEAACAEKMAQNPPI